MSQKRTKTASNVASVSYQARDELLRKYPKIEKCLECNTCALVCPVTYKTGFSTTKTYFNNLFRDPEPEKNPNLWFCVSCHMCEEICPYEVKPLEVIDALKEEAFEKGYAQNIQREQIKNVLATGYTFPLLPSRRSINELRGKLGLPPLEEKRADEVKKILRRSGLEEKITRRGME